LGEGIGDGEDIILFEQGLVFLLLAICSWPLAVFRRELIFEPKSAFVYIMPVASSQSPVAFLNTIILSS